MFKLKTIAVLVLAALATFAPGAKAQTSALATTPSAVSMTTLMGLSQLPSSMISGRDMPAQVPDQVVFRMFLTAHTQLGTITGLDKVGFTNPDDTLRLQSAMLSYYTQEKALTAAYNAGPAATGNPGAARDTYWKNYYGLVSNLLAGLQISLSSEGVSQFNDFISGYRKGVLISPYDAGLPNEIGKLNLERDLAEKSMTAGLPGAPMPTGSGVTPNYSVTFETSQAFPQYDYQDTLRESNEPLNSAVWQVPLGAISIIGQQAVPTNNVGLGAWAVYTGAPKLGFDQCNSIQISTLPPVGGFVQVSTRMTSNSQNGYIGYIYNAGGGVYEFAVGAYVNSKWTPLTGNVQSTNYDGLNDGASFTPQPFDVLMLCSIGNSQDLYYGSKQLGTLNYYTFLAGASDTTFTSGYGGFGFGGALGGGADYFNNRFGSSILIANTLSGDSVCSTGCSTDTVQGLVASQMGTQGGIVYSPVVVPTKVIDVYNSNVLLYDDPGEVYGPDFGIDVTLDPGNIPIFSTAGPDNGTNKVSQEAWTACPGGKCSHWFWNATTVATLDPKSQYSSAFTGYNYTLSINCAAATSPPDYIPPTTAISEWTIKPPAKNWEYFGYCVAPPLGEHAGFYFCAPNAVIGILAGRGSPGAPVPAYWLQFAWGPWTCTKNGYLGGDPVEE